MEYSSADLRKLAEKKRSRNNMEAVQSLLSDIEETKDTIEEWAQSSQEAVSALLEFEEKTQELAEQEIISGDILAKVQEALEAVRPFLPDGDSVIGQFSECHGEATSGVEELESMLEDRDYGAEERDEKWYEITDQIVNLAEGLDELDNLGAVKAGEDSD